MKPSHATAILLAAWIVNGSAGICLSQTDAVLPAGVKAVWGLDKASREKSPTRERLCLNGLWRWQPVATAVLAKDGVEGGAPPADTWGYFKVPGCWPGISDYMQKDCQTVYAHPSWKDTKLGGVTAAWYQREVPIPAEWVGRRVVLYAEYLNSYAVAYLDGKKVGELRFPAGEIDVTGVCKPGGKHLLSMMVVAMPLKGVMLSHSDSAAAKEVKGRVDRRGLCGDVYLVASPAGPRIVDVKVDTSVRKGELALDVAMEGLAADKNYTLSPMIVEDGKKDDEGMLLMQRLFKGSDIKTGRLAYVLEWKPGKLWDIHTPQNQFRLTLTLLEQPDQPTVKPEGVKVAGKVLDVALPVRFGFREFWIDGRDFYLNGSRIFLSAVPLDNAQVSAGLATYAAARESMLRLKSFGINLVYTHNYGCEPGTHLSFAEILRAADDVGMLVSFSQPHFSQYDWKSPDADAANGYARHAEFYVRAAQNHPAVVMYSMSHNATGYEQDMNPDMIDGLTEPRDTWALNNSKLALRAEAIVRRLDPSRIVYHHASGNLGAMHDVNFYVNMAPIQEMNDWFEHWASTGVKPAFTCEYGVPFTWDWTLYRGWYKGERNFGSAAVPWELCLAEWNAQFLGDRAYRISEAEKADLRWEARQFRDGKLWHRWDYPFEVSSKVFDDRYEVLAMYLADNWRAFRTWGLSANSPWEYGHFWKPRDGVDRKRQELKTDWDNLQQPGFSPDYIEGRFETMPLAFERTDWIATPAAAALIRNNQPLLAYIAGKADHFTEKGHNFLPGETVEKQIVVINNSRETVAYDYRWTVDLVPLRLHGVGSILKIATGQQTRIPLKFDLPVDLPAGKYQIKATVTFSTGDILPPLGGRVGERGEPRDMVPSTQTDTFDIHVLAPPPAAKMGGSIALYDPKGETSKLLDGLGVKATSVQADADLSKFDILIIGKSAMTPDGLGPDISRVRDGLKVIVFEQTSAVLEKRLGFRVQEYGLRRVFPRVPDHPLLDGLSPEHLADWRGAATILPPRLVYESRARYGPTVKWCGIDVTRAWRCGNWGNVASVLIEKPACGDFLPIVDGGFSLQYSPLLEYREGKGIILFCQMDVTGRADAAPADPAADRLARNILNYVSSWKPSPSVGLGKVFYIGEAAGKAHLAAAGFAPNMYDGGKLGPLDVLVVGPGGGRKLADNPAVFPPGGCNLLLVGLDDAEANAIKPLKVTTKKAEHIAAFFNIAPYFDLHGFDWTLAGVGPADVHNRDPRALNLITGGAWIIGDGVLATAQFGLPNEKMPPEGMAVFCQIVPWQFDPAGAAKSHNIKQTYRRVSFLLTRLLCNMRVASATPIIARFKEPVNPKKVESRWLAGLYLDGPEEWDDPYRFFRW